MGTCPDAVKRLIERFNQQSDEIRSPDYKEHLIRVDFLDPLMKELGWDVHNSAGLPLKSREVYPEDRVQIGGQTKAPDYSFRVGEHRKFFLEAKKPSVNIRENYIVKNTVGKLLESRVGFTPPSSFRATAMLWQANVNRWTDSSDLAAPDGFEGRPFVRSRFLAACDDV
jgi:hypothetical protein